MANKGSFSSKNLVILYSLFLMIEQYEFLRHRQGFVIDNPFIYFIKWLTPLPNHDSIFYSDFTFKLLCIYKEFILLSLFWKLFGWYPSMLHKMEDVQCDALNDLFFYNLFKKEEEEKKKRKILENFFLTKSLLKILKKQKINETITTFGF